LTDIVRVVEDQRGIADMKPAKFRVEFGAHVEPGLILSHLTDWGCEVVPRGGSDRTFTVVVSRISQLRGLKHELAIWERNGDLKWSEEAENSN
jgi:hypothetical protein